MQDNVIEDIGAAADELEDITERFIQSVGVNAVESMMTFRGGRHFFIFYPIFSFSDDWGFCNVHRLFSSYSWN